MRGLLILILLTSFMAPLAAFAQSAPPIPRPRPDRAQPLVEQTQNTAQPSKEEESAALQALTTALQSREEPANEPTETGGPPRPVTLSAKITEEGTIIPDGLIWRIFDARADASGQLAQLAKSSDSVAVFDLSPGDYVVHVAYGLSQATDTLRVEPGPNSKTIVLDSGALRLNAAISGDIAIAPDELKFEIFATGENEQDRILVAENVDPGSLVHLNAGVYHIVSHFGDINALVRADLRVEPGQLTDATLYHHAGEVSFKLVSEQGGEAIADVDWTIKSTSGETIYTNFGAFPATILAEGDYTVFAKRGSTVYNRDFQIRAGPAQEIEVLTSVY